MTRGGSPTHSCICVKGCQRWAWSILVSRSACGESPLLVIQHEKQAQLLADQPDQDALLGLEPVARFPKVLGGVDGVPVDLLDHVTLLEAPAIREAVGLHLRD